LFRSDELLAVTPEKDRKKIAGALKELAIGKQWFEAAVKFRDIEAGRT